MPKSLCKSKKTRKKNCTLENVPDATHICRKCGRAANSKKKLCKPQKLS